MKTLLYQKEMDLDTILRRNENEQDDIRNAVLEIIKGVKNDGNAALLYYTQALDHCKLTRLRVSETEIDEAFTLVPDELLTIMREAAENIRAFHEKQLETTWTYSPKPGVILGQHITPIERVGLYVPGGKATYPSTVLMDAIPALVAGVQSLVMVTPPDRNGQINPNILAAAKIAGVHEIYKIGGAQAIAALAYGTETIQPVNKIVGPGNIYVATAKKEVFGKVAIDMIAGPSEVLIIADETANPVYAAADLLSQAEHDEMAMPILVTTSAALGAQVVEEVYRQIEQDLSRKEIAKKSVDEYGFIFIVNDLNEAFELSNQIAPEHLELLIDNPMAALEKVKNAGAIFMGPYSPEPLGDYFAGPNHTLPTSGTAKFSSPLGVYDYLKKSSILSYDEPALAAISQKIAAFARSEGLDGHAKAVERRFEK
ncbi:histidinol dehydrogenase [Acetobacterium woodii]|uniref:Histidinol dehydrogenase n=1 Tax=Acetobacterium woodii (strain ATCC 29683 / DSM 1030 / JCM 2381 / KCTC 1655 / WB1) TaxID=931626 RepID=H6LC47_ACEWD|nr:histidinol dehydrogenase [Acetobacterium woodii]AFA48995.1 histidinol dehydrogenase HisD [Acetobacterium woodii DSM 1030]